MEQLLVREISNKYGSLLHMGTKKRLNISQSHIENLTHEQPIVELLENSKYALFLDVGAAYGYFTRIASHYATRVYAFEPHPIRYGFLSWNTKDLVNVGVSNKIVGPENSISYISPHPAGMAGSHHVHRSVVMHDAPVPLDDTYMSRWESILIKIDVEGNELGVIRSGKDLVASKRVKWIVELHRNIVSKKELFNEFKQHEGKMLLDRKNTEHWLFWKS